MIAAEQSADYVAFGPYDSTATADDLDALKWWQDMMEMPCIAMTGDAAQAENLYQAGADFVLIHQTN